MAEEGQEASPPKPKSDKWGLITLLFALINLAAIGGVAFMMRDMWGQIEHLNARVEEVARPELVDGESPVGTEMQPKNLGVLFPLDGFLVNLASSHGPKFLQAQLELELESPAVEEEVVRKKAAIRDAIIVLMSSRNYTSLREPAGMSDLRGDIKRRLNNQLSTGKIRQVYFTKFHFN